jgi:hypothetical protein
MRESAMAEKLLDFTQPFDVGLLDATVAAFYGTGSKHERAAAERVLRQLQEHPDTWTRVVAVLQNSQNLNSKFYALRVLEGVIKYRWNALPVEQRDGIKNYISDLIVQLSSNEVSFRTERLYVNKLNIILVQASGSSLQCVVMCKLLIGRIGIISFFGTERNVLWVCQIFVVKFLLYKDTGNVDWIPFRASFLQEIDIGMHPGALLVHVG